MIAQGSFLSNDIVGSETKQEGLGVVQEVDAAAMSFWLQWDHETAHVSCGNASGGQCFDSAPPEVLENIGPGTVKSLEAINVVKGGALINF
jgi:hypothetical protein